MIDCKVGNRWFTPKSVRAIYRIWKNNLNDNRDISHFYRFEFISRVNNNPLVIEGSIEELKDLAETLLRYANELEETPRATELTENDIIARELIVLESDLNL